ncbi:Diamine acetyltransferase 2 [Kalmusia sp. IMI 367209]|nr:Diamine acetyltransferase 2 [Kalmusia sp. IMI 367209]
MPNLQVIQSAISKLPDGLPLVAAIPGGTTGIGSYIAKALAKTYANHGDKLRVYIVGRNVMRAENVLSECRQISPGSDWRFVRATDLALISEVDHCCAEIVRQETEAPFRDGVARLDLLYMTYSYPVLKERSTTSEGLDSFIATLYYTRIRFIMQLLPLLTVSTLPSQIVSVYAGTMEDGTKSGEFPVGCPPDSIYGIGAVRKHTSFMKTFMFEELAQKHAGRLRLTHILPGLVDGPGFQSPDVPGWFKVVWRLLKPLLGWYMTSPDVCGQVMVYLATSHFPARGASTEVKNVTRDSRGEVGGGAYSVGQRADAQKGIMYEKVRQADTSKRIWDHTMDVLEKAEKARVPSSRE